MGVDVGGTGRPAGRTGIKIIENKGLMFVRTKETKECGYQCCLLDCLLERVVGLLGELPLRLSDSTKFILILQSFHALKWAIGHYPLTESVGTTAKGTAPLCFIL